MQTLFWKPQYSQNHSIFGVLDIEPWTGVSLCFLSMHIYSRVHSSASAPSQPRPPALGRQQPRLHPSAAGAPSSGVLRRLPSPAPSSCDLTTWRTRSRPPSSQWCPCLADDARSPVLPVVHAKSTIYYILILHFLYYICQYIFYINMPRIKEFWLRTRLIKMACVSTLSSTQASIYNTPSVHKCKTRLIFFQNFNHSSY